MLEYEKNLTTNRRIELFNGMMKDKISDEFYNWLIHTTSINKISWCI